MVLLLPLGILLLVGTVWYAFWRVGHEPGTAAPRASTASLPPLVLPPGHSLTSFASERPVETMATVRMERSHDAPLQFLPGRLEVERGRCRGEEFHFVRQPGERTVFTVGRAPGAPPAHLQLVDETVSRYHARLAFDEGRWTIANLSQTNPTVVNGVPLTDGERARGLEDGDAVEMGGVLLRFRAQ